MSKSNVVRAQLGVILLLVAVYCLQVATPLRLHPDTVVLLSVAETAEHGGGYLYHGRATVFPPGYPTLLAFLIRVNLAHVWVLVSLNVMSAAIGLLAIRNLLRSKGFSDGSVFSVCLLTLLSIVFIKFSATPLTDTIFFGVSMCCLAVMKSAIVQPGLMLRRVLASAALVIASICIRRIGVALIPAFLWMIISRCNIQLRIVRLSFKMKAIGMIVAAAVAVGIAWVVYATSTLRDFTVLSAPSVLIHTLPAHLRELGEITLNSSLPGFSGKSLPLLGLLVLSLFLLGVWREQFGVIEVYVVSYATIILVWPYYDTRFWLPVIPLLVAYCGLSLKLLIPSRELAAYLFVSYAFMFSIVGLLTLAANIRIGLSGSSFADSYPDKRYHSTYCAVWRCKELDSAKIDLDGLHLLRYYGSGVTP